MWETEEDFERDWWAFADCPRDTGLSRSTPPVSQHVKDARTRITRSIYDMDSDNSCDEDVEYCKPSRGRDLNPSFRQPGGRYTSAELRRITTNQIREVIILFISV